LWGTNRGRRKTKTMNGNNAISLQRNEWVEREDGRKGRLHGGDTYKPTKGLTGKKIRWSVVGWEHRMKELDLNGNPGKKKIKEDRGKEPLRAKS